MAYGRRRFFRKSFRRGRRRTFRRKSFRRKGFKRRGKKGKVNYIICANKHKCLISRSHRAWINKTVGLLMSATNPYPKYGAAADKLHWKEARNVMREQCYTNDVRKKYFTMQTGTTRAQISALMQNAPGSAGQGAGNVNAAGPPPAAVHTNQNPNPTTLINQGGQMVRAVESGNPMEIVGDGVQDFTKDGGAREIEHLFFKK